jgi:hypothetical protein
MYVCIVKIEVERLALESLKFCSPICFFNNSSCGMIARKILVYIICGLTFDIAGLFGIMVLISVILKIAFLKIVFFKSLLFKIVKRFGKTC